MCLLIFLPSGDTVSSMIELESTFGLPVDNFHDGAIETKDQCLCHVETEDYLDAVGAT